MNQPVTQQTDLLKWFPVLAMAGGLLATGAVMQTQINAGEERDRVILETIQQIQQRQQVGEIANATERAELKAVQASLTEVKVTLSELERLLREIRSYQNGSAPDAP